MTDAHRNALLKAIDRQTARMTVSKESALAALVEAGVATPEGELTPEFGGRESKAKTAA